MKRVLLAAVAAFVIGGVAQAQIMPGQANVTTPLGQQLAGHSAAYIEAFLKARTEIPNLRRMELENQLLALKLKQLQNGR